MTHVPNVTDFVGFMDLLFICSFFELSNVLSSWEYDKSPSGVPERLRFVKARLHSRHLVLWFFAKYSLIDSSGRRLSTQEGLKETFYTLLARHARALSNYKKEASRVEVYGEHDLCTPKLLDRAINRCLEGTPAADIFADLGPDVNTFAWIGEEYSIVKCLGGIQRKFYCILRL